MNTTVPYALVYLVVNALLLLGVVPWMRLRKQHGLGLRVTDKTRLPRDKTLPRTAGLVRGAITSFCYILLAIIAPLAGIYGLVTMVGALGSEVTTNDVITAEILVTGAAIGLFANYCFLQMAKEDPDFGRDGGS
jgi:hypothetical protein